MVVKMVVRPIVKLRKKTAATKILAVGLQCSSEWLPTINLRQPCAALPCLDAAWGNRLAGVIGFTTPHSTEPMSDPAKSTDSSTATSDHDRATVHGSSGTRSRS
jgi:hypothetical protein